MRQFYLGNNSSGYYRVYFVEPVTGTLGPGKSTHTKSLELLSQKLHKSIIPTLSEEHVETLVEIKNETAELSPAKKCYVVIKKKNSEPLGKKSRKQKAAKSFCFAILLKTYGIMISQSFFYRHIFRGHSMSKKHAFCMHAFVKSYWRPYWGDDTRIEDLTKPEFDDFFFYLYREKQLAGETVNKVINSASRCTRWLYEN